jgi:hypothetical protein
VTIKTNFFINFQGKPMATNPPQKTPVNVAFTAPAAPSEAPVSQDTVATAEPVQEPVQALVVDTPVQPEVAALTDQVVEAPAEPAAPTVEDLQVSTLAAGDLGIKMSDELQCLVGQMSQTYGPWTKIPLFDVARYVEFMKPGSYLEASTGASLQLTLWRNIRGILNVEGPHYIPMISAVLGIIHEYRKAAFADAYVFRFYDSVQMPANERNAMRLLITMLLEVSDPETRLAKAKELRPQRALDTLFSEEAKRRFCDYLHID